MNARTLEKFRKARKWSSVAFMLSYIASMTVLFIPWRLVWPLKIVEIFFYLGVSMTFVSLLVFGPYAFYCMWRCSKAERETLTPTNQ